VGMKQTDDFASVFLSMEISGNPLFGVEGKRLFRRGRPIPEKAEVIGRNDSAANGTVDDAACLEGQPSASGFREPVFEEGVEMYFRRIAH